MFVCLCEGVSDRAIVAAITAGAHTVDELGEACAAGTVCGGCVHYLEEMLEEEMLETVPVSSDPAEPSGGDVA